MRELAERTGVTSIAATVGYPIREPEYRRAFTVMAQERVQASWSRITPRAFQIDS